MVSATVRPDGRASIGAPEAPGPVVRVVTVGAVLLVAAVAAVVSYAHMREVAARAGEGWRALLLPLSVDGLVVAASMVLLTRRRVGMAGGWLPWCALLGGVGASLAANIAAAEPTATARVVAAWPALAFAVAFELLLQQRRAAVTEPVNSQPVEPGVPVGQDRHIARPVLDGPGEVGAPGAPAGALPAAPVTDPAEQRVGPPTAGDPSFPGPGAVPGRGGLEERARALLAAAGTRRPGRRVLARQLGVSEHQARTVLATVTNRDTHHPNGTSGTGGARPAPGGDRA